MADQHLELTRLHNAVGIRIDDGAIRDRNIEPDGLGLTRLKLHALERFELAVRPAVRGHDVADVGLHDFGALALAGVGERDFRMHGVRLGERAGGGALVIVGSPYAKVV